MTVRRVRAVPEDTLGERRGEVHQARPACAFEDSVRQPSVVLLLTRMVFGGIVPHAIGIRGPAQL